MGFIPNLRAEARIYARHILATKREAKIGVIRTTVSARTI
jgi:hypothetical protein